MADTPHSAGEAMHDFATQLMPICRSITGDGVRRTLAEIRTHLPNLALHEVASGTQVFDWVIPDEWNIRSAILTGPDGETVADFRDHNLHVVNYSEPVDVELSLEELQPHLHSLPELPDAIPYITSYFRRNWGFCLTHKARLALKHGKYRARIDSTLAPGSLTYGELIIPGSTDREILLSTYICHPQMANNELSGPCVTTWLAKWLQEKKRRYTYRIIFVPETIGSITYLSRNLAIMKDKTDAGFVVTCVGDEGQYSYLPSRLGGTLSDRVATHVLGQLQPEYVTYPFRERGSDERQYCAPGVDLPVCSVMRTKYGAYLQYHTSLDDLTFVTPNGLGGAYDVLKRCLECLEVNATYRVTVLGEPQLGKRGLYPDTRADTIYQIYNICDLVAYSDGNHDLIAIAERSRVPIWHLTELAEKMHAAGVLERLNHPQ